MSDQAAQRSLAVLLDALNRKRPLVFTGDVLVAFDTDVPDADLWRAQAQMILDADDLAALRTLVPAAGDDDPPFVPFPPPVDELAEEALSDGEADLFAEESGWLPTPPRLRTVAITIAALLAFALLAYVQSQLPVS